MFKLAAFAEAIGWTLLILGIFLRDFILHGNEVGVQLAGRIHGGLFVIYILAVLLLSPSLGWKLPQTIVAGLCSIPPYGSLIYERIVAHYRQISAAYYLQQRHRFIRFLTTNES